MDRPAQIHDDQTLILFGGKGDPWSNFAHHRMQVRCPWCGSDLNVLTNEHGFQAAKAQACEAFHEIATQGGPSIARRSGKKVLLRPDWDSPNDESLTIIPAVATDAPRWDGMKTKEWVMSQLIIAKFRGPLLSDLHATQPHVLVERAPWDPYWGAGRNGTGKNMLGRILMAVRDGGSLPPQTPTINTTS